MYHTRMKIRKGVGGKRIPANSQSNTTVFMEHVFPLKVV